MKFGVNTWVWTAPLTTEGVAELAPLVAEMGFDVIEVPLEDLSLIDFTKAAAIIRDHGLGVSACVAMGPDRDLIHPEKPIRDNGMQYIRDAIDATEALGGTNLVGPIYAAVGRTWKAPPEQRQEETDLLVDQLSQLASYAGDHGVALGLEPLNRFETSFINLAEQVVEVVDRVDHPACGVMLDTFHMNIEEKSLGDAIRRVGPRLKHIHTCENDRGIPGSGNVAWDEVAAALRDIEYDGPAVIESFTDKVESIARAAAIWRTLAPSQDALAREGLAFLREKLG